MAKTHLLPLDQLVPVEVAHGTPIEVRDLARHDGLLPGRVGRAVPLGDLLPESGALRRS